LLRACRTLFQRFDTVGHLTDVEGNWDYFQQYVKTSSVLTVDKNGDVQLNENCSFVFGGDLCDKGAGDIRIGRALVSLKNRYPDRVFLIIGQSCQDVGI
jgi:hypothetical protein